LKYGKKFSYSELINLSIGIKASDAPLIQYLSPPLFFGPSLNT